MEVVLTGHGAYHLKYHIVWVTKYRRKILKPGVAEYIRKILPKLARSMAGVKVEQIGFDQDHLHLVLEIPPKFSIADVMRLLKNQSASLLREKFDFLKKVYWNENIVWSPGYFVSSVGINEAIIQHYVEFQGKKDLGQLRMEL